MHNRVQIGFTLIEIMITVVVIGILAAISIPLYQDYARQASIHSCLSETKSYSNDVFYTLNDQNVSTSPGSPTVRACQSITDATDWTLSTQGLLIGVPKSESTIRIECSVISGSSCKLVP